MRVWKAFLNLAFFGILILAGAELSDLFLNYVNNVFAEEEIEGSISIGNREGEAKTVTDLSRYLEGKRTLSRNILDIPEERKAEGSGKPESKEERTKEEKRIDIKLLGVVSGAREEAIVSEGGTLRRVKVGDEVAGYKVIRIERDLVILQKGDETVEISFQYGATSSESKPQRPTEVRREPEPPPQRTEAPSPEVTQNSEGKFVISRDTVNQFLMAPQNFLKGIFIGPNFKDNKPYGFAVRNVSDSHILAKLGVKKGDVIKKLNGIEINTITDYYNAIRSVSEGDSLTISIEREGKEIDIQCEIR